MTNEAVLLTDTHIPIPFTVSDSTGIEKGTLLKLTDLQTAIKASGTADPVAGIAAKEKIASNGKTKLAVYRGGVFRVIASGSIVLGNPVGIAGLGGLNYVYDIVGSGSLSGSVVLGIALEAATDEETFRMELRPGAVRDTRGI